MLIDIRPRIRKPLYGRVEIEESHPLAIGLTGGVVLNEDGGPPLELRQLNRATFTASTPIWKSAPGSERALFFDLNNTQAVTVPMPIVPATATGISWAFALNVASAGGGSGGGRIFTNGISDNAAPQIQWVGSGLGVINIMDHRSLADASCATSGANIAVNTDCHIVIADDQTIVLSPTMFKAYFNGVSSSLTAGSNALGTISDPTSYSIGGLASLAARSIDGVLYYFYKYARVLTQTEALWLKAEPYAFLRQRPAITYSFMRGTTAAAVTTVFRRTLSALGTRTGSRQVHF